MLQIASKVAVSHKFDAVQKRAGAVRVSEIENVSFESFQYSVARKVCALD